MGKSWNLASTFTSYREVAKREGDGQIRSNTHKIATVTDTR
jgi:hypothetical protein